MKAQIAFVVLITFSISLIAAAQQSSVSGQIADSEGAAVEKARVLVRWDSSGSTVGLKDNIGIQQDVTATADATGRYLIVLPPGFYDVFVSAQSFTPAAAKVRVNTGQNSTFNTRLNAD